MRWIPLVVLLAGCTPSVTSSTAAGGIIDMKYMVAGQSEAMKKAEAECAKFGKVAKPEGVNEIRNSMRYSCVAE